MGLLDPTAFLNDPAQQAGVSVDPSILAGVQGALAPVQAPAPVTPDMADQAVQSATDYAPDPRAGIAQMLTDPYSAIRAEAKAHPFLAALSTLGATLQDMGSSWQGRPATAIAGNNADLAARAQAPLQVAQQRATWRGLQEIRASLPPSELPAFDASPQEYAAQLVKNRALQKLSGGESLAGAQGISATAPVLGVDPKSGVPFVQTTGGFTPQGQLGGDYTAGAGGIYSQRTGPGSFVGVGQPLTYNPGQGVTTFTPGVAGQPSAQPGAASQGGLVGPDGKLDPNAFFQSFVLKHEGGFNPADMNGSPTNYGINQAANPNVDVRKLTPEQAGGIFTQKYYGPSGSANLPPALAAVNADTAFINPLKARQFLTQSGGDWQKYMALRSQWMGALVRSNPAAAKYANAWGRRNADLANLAGSLGSQGAPQGAPGETGATPAPQGAPGPQGGGFGPALVAPRVPQPIAPAEARQLGLGPGAWARQPDGTVKLVSEPPKEDLARIGSLQSTVQGLQQLQQEQQNFLAHNRNFGTAPVYAEPEVHGIPLNPLPAVLGATNPDMKSMQASEAKQLFMVKPANAGARILQSELPYWERQTQSVANTGDVNQGILQNTGQSLAQAQRQSDFYTDWMYQHGSLNGADAAWSKAQKGNGQQQAAAHPSGQAMPQMGEVRQGYRYKGGDPASPQSWVRQ